MITFNQLLVALIVLLMLLIAVVILVLLLPCSTYRQTEAVAQLISKQKWNPIETVAER